MNAPQLWFGLITLFPQLFDVLQFGVTGKAIQKQLMSISCWNPRDFTTDKHHTVDHSPYGGGPGMVMMAEPLSAALQAAKNAAPSPPVIVYLTPQGKPFTQEKAQACTSQNAFILLSGRYEGIDERIIEKEIDEEWSIGDYVLTGGEFASLIVIDAITRLLPQTLGNQDSAYLDSLSTGLLKYPQYTRPRIWNQLSVPDILLNGNHDLINQWRMKQSLGKTWVKRPDLLAKKTLNEVEIALLNEFIAEQAIKK